MRKYLAILMAVLLICSMTVAFAAEPITVDIQAVDYQTGKAVS